MIQGGSVAGFFYSLSDDLMNWSQRKLIREAELTWSFKCGDPNARLLPLRAGPDVVLPELRHDRPDPVPVLHALPLPQLRADLNRDLVRVPIRFSK